MPKYTQKDLQAAIKHARAEPNIPTKRISELYGVDRQTLRRRLVGTHQDRSIAYRDEQLLSPGDEKAIADHVGMMADAGFPLNHTLLRQIAQDIVNERQLPQQGKEGGITGPRASTSNPQYR